MAEQGARGAAAALSLANSPTRFLSTVQIGITLVGIFAGAFGGATIARRLGEWLQAIAPGLPHSEAISVAIVVIGITYLSLVLGELVPKRIALSNAERVASLVAPLMIVLSRMAGPFVRLLSLSTDSVVRLLPWKLPTQSAVSEEEIILLIEEGREQGVFATAEQHMIEQVFDLDQRSIQTVMTTRMQVIWLDSEAPPEKIIDTIQSSRHTSYPVGRGSLDEVLGVVQAKDLLAQVLNGAPLDLPAAIRPALFVPESISVLTLLERLKAARAHLALVIDEYAGLHGLVTLTDILEAIAGEIPLPGETAGPGVVRRADGSWLIDGRLPIDDLEDHIGRRVRHPAIDDHYQTIGGHVMALLQRIPQAGDRVMWRGLQFEVVDMDGRRVDKVLITPLAQHKDEPGTP
jgi:putative hemolysin